MMTEPTETTETGSTSTTSVIVSVNSSKHGHGLKDKLLRPRQTNLLSAIVAAAVLAVCGVLLFLGYKSIRDEQAAAVEREAVKTRVEGIQRSYDADIRLYDKKVSDYNTCLVNATTRARTRDDLRAVLYNFADGIGETASKLFPDADSVKLFADTFAADRKKFVDDSYPKLSEQAEQSMCPTPGPEPVKPPELQ